MATLLDGVQAVREKLGEGNPWLFDNNIIIKNLNRSARAMSSVGRFLSTSYAFNTGKIQSSNVALQTQMAQEYQMPADMITPTGDVKCDIGMLYPVTIRPQAKLQIGGFVSSIPFMGYFRRGRILTSMVGPGANNSEVVYPGVDQGGGNWILGFYPVPSTAYPIIVDYVQYHYDMKQPMDQLLIPDETDYFDTWVAYAVARGKEKEGDLESASQYDQIHKTGLVRFKDDMANTQQAICPAYYNEDSMFDNDSLGVIAIAPLNPRIY